MHPVIPSSRPALQRGHHALTFADLADAIAAEAERIQAPEHAIGVLEARPDFDFVIQLLARRQRAMPVALLPEDASETETAARLHTLGRWCRWDDAGQIVDLAPQPPRHHPDTRLVLFTSGSTGAPRAVQLSEANLFANQAAVLEALHFDRVPHQHLALPLHHGFGLLGQLLPALEAQVPTRLTDWMQMRDDARQDRLSGMLSGVPAHFETLLRLIPPDSVHSQVTHVVTAGAPLPEPLRRRLRATFDRAVIYTNYGQTELSPRALCLTSDHPAFLSDATGYPVRGIEAKLTPAHELAIRGPQVMLGYLGDDEATDRKLTNGWWHTQDLANMDDDGLVTVRGRIDDVVQVGGERVSPVEVEVALSAIAGIDAAGVVGVSDRLHGHVFHAYVVLHDDAITYDAIMTHLVEQLSPPKRPRAIFVVPDLPRTPTGKLKRAALRDLRTARRLH